MVPAQPLGVRNAISKQGAIELAAGFCPTAASGCGGKRLRSAACHQLAVVNVFMHKASAQPEGRFVLSTSLRTRFLFAWSSFSLRFFSH